MMFSFSSVLPIYIGLAIAILGGIFSWRRVGYLTSDYIRAAIVLIFLSLAFAGPELHSQNEEDVSHITALVDVSSSMRDTAELEQILHKLPTGSRCIAFSDEAREVSCANIQKSSSTKTNLVAALQKAKGTSLLISDARENVESAEEQLGSGLSGKFTLYPVILSATNIAPRITQITYPPFVRAQQKFSLGVSVAGVGKISDLRVSVERSSDKSPTHVETQSQPIANTQSLSKQDFQFLPAEKFSGLEAFTASLLDPTGRVLDSRTVLVGTNTENAILLISHQEALVDPLSETLKEQGFKITISPNGGQLELPTFRAVILVNTAKDELSSVFQEHVVAYVKQGGTLIMTGGPKSFAAGGYKGSAIGDLLPVNLLPPETVQKRLSVAVALVLDKSGSMAQGEKLDGAKDAAREVVRNLKDDDTIAVIGFDDAPFVVLRASPVGQVRDLAAERIGRLFPAGRTNLIPALDEARRMLSKVDAGRKHVIVMTDGRLPDESDFYFELLRQMRFAGVTVSTVLLGGENDFSFLKRMADVGGGGFYQTSDPRLLPRIFLQDIKVSVDAPPPAKDFAVREIKPVSVKLGDYPNVTSISPATMKDQATLELAANAGDTNKPFLASWSVQSGKTFAFMSDIVGQQTAAWFRWSKLGEFWREVISGIGGDGDLRAKDKEPAITFSVEQRGQFTALNLTLYNVSSKINPDWRVTGPDGIEIQHKKFNEIVPGRYRGLIQTSTPGNYTVRGIDVLPPIGFAVRQQDFSDRPQDSIDDTYLRRLAQMTGGTVLNSDLDGLAQIAADRKKSVETHLDLTWVAILLAFIAQLVGMAMRS